MADPASLVANPNFAPGVTDPNLRSLLTDADFAWRMKEYLRERQLEIDAQEPPIVYADQPSWPDFNVWERKGLPPFTQEDPVGERAIDAASLIIGNLVSGNDESTSYVFKGSYKNVDVSVIIPNFDFIDFQSTRKFCDQIARAKFLDHKNVLKVLGLTTDSEEALMIVTEPLTDATLYSFIREKARELDVVQTSLQICDAMKYLEDRGVHHGDLCTKNIFVNTDNVVKVLIGINPFGERVHEGFQTLRTDVFSFGVVMWEMIRDAQLFKSIPKRSKCLEKKDKTWEDTCSEVCGLLKSCVDTKNPIVNVIEKCWEVQKTPLSFSSISKMLKTILVAQGKEVYADDDDDDTPKKVKRNRKGKTKEAFGVFGCNSCNRTFRSQIAVEVHSMAKHK